jgi:hypothetical protein
MVWTEDPHEVLEQLGEHRQRARRAIGHSSPLRELLAT